MIRLATQDDVPRIAELGELFFAEAGWSDVAEWDHDSITVTLASMIGSDNGIVLVLEVDGLVVGMAGGLIYPHYFNKHHLTGQEIFWWVSPEHRGRNGIALLDELEAEAKRRGAKSFSMIALAKVDPERVGRMYEKRGYRAAEHSFIRTL